MSGNKKLQEKADKIYLILEKRYPQAKTSLNHKNAFQLLIATILSAQCTDERVNQVTKVLFEKYKTPYDFVNEDVQVIEELIKPTGFFRNKAKNIKKCCEELIKRYDGKVPSDIEKLTKLPGVGRKTANVVLGDVFGIPGIVVDTHVKRISYRLGLTKNKDPLKIEKDLEKIIPKERWIKWGHLLIYFGREICKARKPLCEKCPIEYLCEKRGVK